MTKYTRREFFKSIIPVSVGIVSFLGSDKNSLDMLDEYDFSKGVQGKYARRYVEYSECPGLDHIINTGKNYSDEVSPQMYSRNSDTLISSIDGGINWYEIE